LLQDLLFVKTHSGYFYQLTSALRTPLTAVWIFMAF
jgi:hypothetical protein